MSNPIDLLTAPRADQAVIAGDLSGAVKPQNLHQAAQQFEAMFMKMMFQQMRKASDALNDDSDPLSSKQQKMMRDLHDDVLASKLASQGSLGIAELLVKQLGGKERL